MSRKNIRILAALATFAAMALAQQVGIDLSALTGGEPAQVVLPSGDATLARIAEAAESRTSGFMVTVDARVEKTLRDDNEGSRHQRFLIELADGRILLVAHNIDLADRVDLRDGDRVRVRGQYEWNEKGGVLHWTHHDPRGRHEGGWIEHEGTRVE